VRKALRQAATVSILPAETALQAKARFASETTRSFDKFHSVSSSYYERVAPGPGFDRKTASRTNYSLSMPGHEDPSEWKSATHRIQSQRLRDRVGEPLVSTEPRRDVPIDYDIVTGAPVDPRRTYYPRGAKKCDDREIVTRTRTTYVDPTRGVELPVTRVRRDPPASVRPPLGTLASVRPPTPTGTDWYKGLQR
jgi:hypothetical protein